MARKSGPTSNSERLADLRRRLEELARDLAAPEQRKLTPVPVPPPTRRFPRG